MSRAYCLSLAWPARNPGGDGQDGQDAEDMYKKKATIPN